MAREISNKLSAKKEQMKNTKKTEELSKKKKKNAENLHHAGFALRFDADSFHDVFDDLRKVMIGISLFQI